MAKVDCWEVWVACDFFDAGEDFASSWGVLDMVHSNLEVKVRPTKVVKAVLPAPLGPRSRKLLEGGEATAWKKMMWRRTGTPNVNAMAMAIATRLPSNNSVAMPVTECQFAWEDMVEEGKFTSEI